ncbi:MAG: WD40 repeat domain-containing protein [Caulobacterales bacterium]
MIRDLGAFVTTALFDREGRAAFALGDGTVAFEGGERTAAHNGAILGACVHPSGVGVVSGGDDGALVWSRADAADRVAEVKGRWIDSVDASADSGLLAFSAGREVRVLDVADPAFERVFQHERSVADVAFDPRGRRIAAATYGGAMLWYARIADQKPVMLRWAGSHIGLAFSPDGRFLISAMQENALHGWRLSDAKDMRMGGYPAKIRGLVFFEDGQFLATSGANGAVVWPFAGANGPMGKQAIEVGFDQSALVLRVAAAPKRSLIAAGLDDGRVWVCDFKLQKTETIKAEKGPPISALAMSPTGRIAWGEMRGFAD